MSVKATDCAINMHNNYKLLQKKLKKNRKCKITVQKAITFDIRNKEK